VRRKRLGGAREEGGDAGATTNHPSLIETTQMKCDNWGRKEIRNVYKRKKGTGRGDWFVWFFFAKRVVKKKMGGWMWVVVQLKEQGKTKISIKRTGKEGVQYGGGGKLFHVRPHGPPG